MTRTFYKPRTPGTLKAAQAALIAACGGAAAVAKPACRLAKTALCDAADSDKPDRNLPADVIARLESICGKPIFAEFLAAERGCIVEPIKPTNLETLPVAVGNITTQLGELLSAVAPSMRDGNLTHANAVLVLRETDDVIAAVLTMRAMARQIVEGDGDGR